MLRKSVTLRASKAQCILTFLIGSSIIYFYFCLQFVIKLDVEKQLARTKSRSHLEDDTILELPKSGLVKKNPEAGSGGEDDDGSGKHRPYPFKVVSSCPSNHVIEYLDEIRTHRNERIISIRGERHTGTKLIRILLNHNMKGIQRLNGKLAIVNMTMDTIYGWKHGFFPSNFVIHPLDVFLIVTRDPFSWALSMFRDPYNMIFHENTTNFGPFLMGSYTSQNCEAPHYMKKCVFPMEQSNNIIQLRTAKYKNWTSDSTIPWSLIRYEDIATNQRIILDFLDRHGFPHNDIRSFQRADSYIGFRGETDKAFTPKTLREQFLAYYTIDEIRFVMKNLDLDFERTVLNYTYEEVDSYIHDRLEGRKPYRGSQKLLDVNVRARIAKMESFRLGILTRNEYDC